MFHEILLSLVGFPGNVVVENAEGFIIREDYDLLIQSERLQLNKIVHIGWIFNKLNSFVTQDNVAIYSHSDSFQLYRGAFAQGINDLLQEYVSHIASIEQYIISEGPVPISHLHQETQKFQLVFPVIYGLYRDIHSKHMRGCQLLDYLDNYRSGLPVVMDVVNSLLQNIRKVFINQTVIWMIHGILQDEGGEFFIQHRQGQHSHTTTSSSRITNKTTTSSDEEENIESSNISTNISARLTAILSPEKHTSTTASSLSSSSPPLPQDSSKFSTGSKSIEKFTWNTTYGLRFEYLPETHVSPRIATKILFAGKAVHLLQSTEKFRGNFFYKSSSQSGTETMTGTGTGTLTGSLLNEDGEEMSVEWLDLLRYLSVHTGSHLSVLAYNTAPPRISVSPVMERDRNRGIQLSAARTTADVARSGGSGGLTDAPQTDDDQDADVEGGRASDGDRKSGEMDQQGNQDGNSRLTKQEDNRVNIGPIDNSKGVDTGGSGRTGTSPKKISLLTYLETAEAHETNLANHHKQQYQPPQPLQSSIQPVKPVVSFSDDMLESYFHQSGYSVEDIRRFEEKLQSLLHYPKLTIELFENLVYDINNTISKRLWTVLKNHYDFELYLRLIRNTYLLGQGELFQIICDEIIEICYHGNQQQEQQPKKLSYQNNYSHYSQLQSNLNEYLWKIIGNCTKILSLDTSSFRKLIQISVENPSIVISDFRRDDLRLEGDASVVMGGLSGKGYVANCLICGSRTQLQRKLYMKNVDETVKSLLSNNRFIKGKISKDSTKANVPSNQEGPTSLAAAVTARDEVGALTVWSRGGVWLAESKYVGRGFTSSLQFKLSPNIIQLSSRLLNIPSRDASAELTLGCLTLVLLGGQTRPSTDGIYSSIESNPVPLLPNSVLAGISIHGRYLDTPPQSTGAREIQLYCRIFIGKVGFPTATLGHTSFSRRAGVSGHIVGLDGDHSNENGDIEILAERVVEANVVTTASISNNRRDDQLRKIMGLDGLLVMDVDYNRELSTAEDAGGRGIIRYRMKIRVRELSSTSTSTSTPSASSHIPLKDDLLSWDAEALIDIGQLLKLPNGQSNIGIVGTGVASTDDTRDGRVSSLSQGKSQGTTRASSSLHITILKFLFTGKATSSLSPNSANSSFEKLLIRQPMLANKLRDWVSSLEMFMGLKMNVKLPSVLDVIFDEEAVASFGRIFRVLFKVRLVMYLLERLWMFTSRSSHENSRHRRGNSSGSGGDGSLSRLLSHTKHMMLFFISNLFYYLQVDAVDAEFSTLLHDLHNTDDLQTVLRTHRNFISNILKISMVDNITVVESLDRILHVCLRFIAVSWLLRSSDDSGTVGNTNNTKVQKGVSLNIEETELLFEEVQFIREDFQRTSSYLFQLMRKVENRGFMFRLDFNSFMSDKLFNNLR